MSDYISREAASADSGRNKIKTPFAKIIVEGTPEKPCYNIWYFDPADGECHIGFGSYCLGNVSSWLAEEFEVMEPTTDVEPVRRGRWEECNWVDVDEHGFGTRRTFKAGLRCSQCACVFKKKLLWKRNYCPSCGNKMDLADGTDWQPLPEPPKEENDETIDG